MSKCNYTFKLLLNIFLNSKEKIFFLCFLLEVWVWQSRSLCCLHIFLFLLYYKRPGSWFIHWGMQKDSSFRFKYSFPENGKKFAQCSWIICTLKRCIFLVFMALWMQCCAECNTQPHLPPECNSYKESSLCQWKVITRTDCKKWS